MRTLIALYLTLATGLASAQADYSKTAELPPLRVSFAAMQTVLDKTERLVTSANSGTKPRREQVVLKAGAIQVTIPGRTLAPQNAMVPEQIYWLTYTYLMPDQAPITRVYFDFSDYKRTLTIEGSSPEQVDAIFAATREELTNLSSVVGGSTIKSYLGFPINWMLLTVMGWFGADWYSKRGARSLGILISAASIILLLVALPIDDLLAGFMAIRGEPSFMIRYGAVISFIGMVIAVVGVPLTVFQARWIK